LRAPVDTIEAPPFLPQLRWVNVKRLRMDRLLGRPVLIEFFDFCRPNSMRTLPYLKEWHARYGAPPPEPLSARAQRDHDAPEDDPPAAPALQVVGIHSPGFEPGRDRKTVLAAVQRLGIEYPVMLDPKLEMWREYENLGWPARYLFGPDGVLFEYHYGEGGYEDTELAIQELLGLDEPPEPLQALRPEDAPGAVLAPQTEDQEGAYEGPYEAGGVWAVLAGEGIVEVNGGEGHGGATISVRHPGAYPLIEHERHTKGRLRLQLDGGVSCLATCFTPGVA
jgi:hypothetical protein